ncbi:helix-turn-helix domain-containing protein [Listeria monocytogenes]|uniref:helix-turn-helix domain-containing protein n=1 Tax=Listeria TaxID=1637 RepID=UPI0001697B98|nr:MULTISPECIES: helix-turn-helix transcriptional regulator [Listeria]EAC5142052.1 XRE family transcriptional regulator [Listeria monocytogenes]EAC7686791.1 XRE family transcriptional regulator [Listeria monocytogenes]EAC7907027.1 XRE family transcriptional regulator [Listeria monocytogenes]EAC8076375.1 XRE family transcriptional regulator [Listeria monocytogenes]EAC9017144.1 XRE family transcriptional regulator [Listeria monocytogenes]
MAFSYKRLWKLLIDKNMNKTALREAIGITPTTLARLSKDQNVTMDVLGKICHELDCGIEDIVEYIEDNNNEVGGF